MIFSLEQGDFQLAPADLLIFLFAAMEQRSWRLSCTGNVDRSLILAEKKSLILS